MKALKVAVLVALLVAVPAALVGWLGWDNILGFFVEPSADVSSPKQHTDSHVSFSYPGNWTVTSDKTISHGVEVHTREVQSPGSVNTIVQTFQPAVPMSIDELAQSFVGEFDEELASNWAGLIKSQNARISPVDLSLLGKKREGKRINITLRALNERVPCTLEIVFAVEDTLTTVVVSVVPDEDLDAAGPGVELVRNTISINAE